MTNRSICEAAIIVATEAHAEQRERAGPIGRAEVAAAQARREDARA